MWMAGLPVRRQDISGLSHGEIYTFRSFSLTAISLIFSSQCWIEESYYVILRFRYWNQKDNP